MCIFLQYYYCGFALCIIIIKYYILLLFARTEQCICDLHGKKGAFILINKLLIIGDYFQLLIMID